MRKNVLITGAAKRIGANLALRFAEKKWNVIIHYNTSEKEAIQLKNQIINHGIEVSVLKADLTNENEIINLFSEINAIYGKLDVLINNAGIFHQPLDNPQIDANFWDKIFNINLRSQFLTSREFAKYANENAKIINFASLGGLEIWKKRIPYNVSKAAAIQLTKALAREFAPKISVNCICPGIVKIDEDEHFAISTEKIPMQRYATSGDIFEAVYFFATCTPYITAQLLLIDGGLNIAK